MTPASLAPRTYSCRRAASPPPIDGRADSPAWNPAPWSELFIDIEGDAKPRPPLDTRVRMLWDDRALYIAASLQDPHVRATLTQRDSIVYLDNDFEVFLCPSTPSRDGPPYYELELNALNTAFDLFLTKPYSAGGRADHAFDFKGLRSAVHIDGPLNDPRTPGRGWSLTIAIPWTSLDRHSPLPPRPPTPGDSWRINFSRVHWDHHLADGRYQNIPGRPEHNWVWSPMGEINMHIPSRWGLVTFTES